MPVAAKPTFLQACKALYASIDGMPELWLDEAPESVTTYPRTILRHGGEAPMEPLDYDGGLPSRSEAEVTFEIYGENDSDAVETLAIALMGAFTATALQLTTDAAPLLIRTGYQVGQTKQRSPSSKPVFRASVGYRAQFNTNY